MAAFLMFTGIGQVALALLAWMVSSSVMHEIAAAILLGFGIVSIGLAGITHRLDNRHP